jgi:hypothetical protein
VALLLELTPKALSRLSKLVCRPLVSELEELLESELEDEDEDELLALASCSIRLCRSDWTFGWPDEAIDVVDDVDEPDDDDEPPPSSQPDPPEPLDLCACRAARSDCMKSASAWPWVAEVDEDDEDEDDVDEDDVDEDDDELELDEPSTPICCSALAIAPSMPPPGGGPGGGPCMAPLLPALLDWTFEL